MQAMVPVVGAWRGAASCLLAALATAAATDAWAQQSIEQARRSAVVTAITSPITLDGLLDEPAWSDAPKIGELVQRQPEVGNAPTERTEVTLLYDPDNLYIGVVAHDSEPERIVATQLSRDAGLGNDDRIEIVLDTFRDQRNAFYFATNPAGTLVDGLAFANGDSNNEWDTIWNVRTRRTSTGWVAEFAIPFKSLSFPAGRTVWGFNVSRSVNRKLEEDRWSGARLETRFLQVSEAGEITGLAGLTQGIGLDIRPFLAGTRLHLGSAASNDFDGKPGFDLFYNITSSLKLSATVNTDFGETEVDARQINLGRFSLLFPEKRAFFLEDVGVFAFGSTGPPPAGGIPATGADVFPFFSRRIGLVGGQEVPIDIGVKFTGKVGRTDIGLLDVGTREVALSDTKNFLVGRIKRNFLQQSYVGAIVTDGDPATLQTGRTFGADLRLATSRLFGDSRNLEINAYGLRSVNEGVSERDWSYGFSANYPNDKYTAQIAVREIQDNFRPAVGFVQRDNVRLLRIAGGYNPRPRNFLNMQQMFHDVVYTQFTRLDNGELESSSLYITPIDWHLRNGDSIHALLDIEVARERLFEPFTISPGVRLPVGEYRFVRFKSGPITTAPRRMFSGSASLTFGEYWSGRAEQVTTAISFRMPPKFTASFNTNQTFARLPEGHFTARIFTTSVAYTASPGLAFQNLIQFDNRSRNLGWQSRVRWTLRPGDDLFFVLNQGWIREDADNLRFRAQDSKVSAKFQYTFRF
jgi:hypothetical protein